MSAAAVAARAGVADRSGPPSPSPRAGGPAHVGVVGGGMLGLALALRLRRQGHRVTVLEGADRHGGLAAAADLGAGVTWDRFYHVVLPADTALQELLAELGLADRLVWRTTRTGFFTGGRLISMSSALDFARFPAIGLLDKARLAFTVLYAARLRDWRPLERVPVAEWLGRLSGRRTLERVWLPLLRSKLGENYRVTSASFIWATIARLYGARQAGAKRERFGYVRGGYAAVLARLAERLAGDGVELRAGARAAAVEQQEGGGVAVRLAGGEALAFDHVALTLSTGRIAALCPQLTAAERARLEGVTYQGIVCASVLLRRPLSGYYVTNITDPGFPLTGVIEMTALVDPAEVGGHTLVYLPRYLAQDDPLWGAGDAEVGAAFLGGLRRMYPDLRDDDVVAVRVARAREVLALTTLDYSARWLPPVRTSLPGVSVVTSAQIAAGTLNVNETLRVADAGAAALGPVLAAAGTPGGAP